MVFSAIIADPHKIARKGTRQLIEDLDGQVIAEVETASEAIDFLNVAELDLLVSELDLSSGNGLELLAQLRRRNIGTSPLILTDREARPYASASLQLGARGIVFKSDPLKEIETAIQSVLAGRRHLSERLPKKLIDQLPSANEEVLLAECLDEELLEEAVLETAANPLEDLTDRQRQVLRLTAEGLTAEEVGERLSISNRTVDKHRENIRNKLDLENNVDMTRFAFQHGLVGPQPLGENGAAGQCQ